MKDLTEEIKKILNKYPKALYDGARAVVVNVAAIEINQLFQAPEEVSREHELTKDCWCKPAVVSVEPEEVLLDYKEYDKVRGYGAPCAYVLMKPYLQAQANKAKLYYKKVIEGIFGEIESALAEDDKWVVITRKFLDNLKSKMEAKNVKED